MSDLFILFWAEIIFQENMSSAKTTLQDNSPAKQIIDDGEVEKLVTIRNVAAVNPNSDKKLNEHYTRAAMSDAVPVNLNSAKVLSHFGHDGNLKTETSPLLDPLAQIENFNLARNINSKEEISDENCADDENCNSADAKRETQLEVEIEILQRELQRIRSKHKSSTPVRAAGWEFGTFDFSTLSERSHRGKQPLVYEWPPSELEDALQQRRGASREAGSASKCPAFSRESPRKITFHY